MADLDHTYSGDLSVSANGDLLTADSLELSKQLVLRRLLTNPWAYIWHPEYGAGLPAMIGQPIDAPTVSGIITAQMFLEASVVQDPPPTITVTPIANGMFVEIAYFETDSGEQVTLAFNPADLNQ
jgi:hypothetical protein